MTTALSTLKVSLCGASPGDQGIIQDSAFYAGIVTRINNAVKAIAGGIRMPDGQISPPLPDLYDMDTVDTSTSYPYVALPDDYQRHVFMVSDSNGNELYPPRGGDHYSFALFLRQANKKDLTQAGSVDRVCVKGTKLYYQGIPSSSKTLTVHFYRLPVDMSDDADTVDGLPDHLAQRLIDHYVSKEIFGAYIEDGDNNMAVGFKYHSSRFYEAMTDLMDHIGIDAIPQYYGEGSGIDLGICD
jgi:hypothetical protein